MSLDSAGSRLDRISGYHSRKRQTCFLSRSHLPDFESRNEKNLAVLKNFNLKTIVTGGRLPLVWNLSCRQSRRECSPPPSGSECRSWQSPIRKALLLEISNEAMTISPTEISGDPTLRLWEVAKVGAREMRENQHVGYRPIIFADNSRSDVYSDVLTSETG